MRNEIVNLGVKTLIGITVRTKNKDEMNPETGKIGPLVNTYWKDQIASKFIGRKSPAITYAAYAEYESDGNGDYTFFIGEEVKSLDEQDQSEFASLIIPSGSYQKFTTEKGKIPDIIMESWMNIWQMRPEDLGGKRNYIVNYEVYDQRVEDPSNAVIDIFIGIEKL